ncbi:hypothetical protein Tco_0896593 [Tanacetum coccineum]
MSSRANIGAENKVTLYFVKLETQSKFAYNSVDFVDLSGKKNVQANKMVKEVQATFTMYHECFKDFNVSDIYEFHLEDEIEDENSGMSSYKVRGNDEDNIEELVEECMEHLEHGKRTRIKKT